MASPPVATLTETAHTAAEYRRTASAPRHGLDGQRPQRELERAARQSAVAFLGQARQGGHSATDAAKLLGVSRRTLGDWQQRAHEEVQPRGPRPVTGDETVRGELVALALLVGPHVGIDTIHHAFATEISRRETAALLGQLRREVDAALDGAHHQLTWLRAGAVWAIDLTQPPAPVDGVFVSILVVRDLASGFQLLAQPLLEATAEAVAGSLAGLVVEHGAPLLYKADNGSNLVCAEAQAPMRAEQVELLRSPPRTPRYNGACEAGIGALATRARHEAARHGRPGRWTCDDVEAARRQANELTRHHHLGGRTPAEVWAERRPISQEERAAFLACAARQRELAARELGLEHGALVAPRQAHCMDRVALQRTLVERGLLSIRGRRECLHN